MKTTILAGGILRRLTLFSFSGRGHLLDGGQKFSFSDGGLNFLEVGSYLSAYFGFCKIHSRIFFSPFLGIVNSWQLCKGSKFEEVRTMLTALNKRFSYQNSNPSIICVDNCCQWRDLLVDVFPGISVKLDVFHGIQRITTTISKKGNSQVRFIRKQMINSLKLSIRKDQDRGIFRSMETAAPGLIIKNLEQFVNHWRDIQVDKLKVLSVDTIDAIEKLKVRVNKGYLSGIPASAGTNRNECLHRILNKVVRKSRIGIQLAVSVLGLFFYRWNERKLTSAKITAPVESHVLSEGQSEE